MRDHTHMRESTAVDVEEEMAQEETLRRAPRLVMEGEGAG